MRFGYIRFLALNRRHKPFLALLGGCSSYSYLFNRRSDKPAKVTCYCTDPGLQLGDRAPPIGLLLWTC